MNSARVGDKKYEGIGGNFSFSGTNENKQKVKVLKEILPPRTTYFFHEIDFILSHFPEPVFPRTISTYKSQGKQFIAFGKEGMVEAYTESNFIDCRVNGYPSYTEFNGVQRYPPNFIFIDLDLSLFESSQVLNKALNRTLLTMKKMISGHPSVLWTGNGYHIYQPIDAMILENLVEFASFEYPSQKFIRFAEFYLSCGKSDPLHNPSFKSCMIRIPGSFNSKYVDGKNQVKLVQKWDGIRPSIKSLLVNFHIYLVNEKIKEFDMKKRLVSGSNQVHSILWIETLLMTPINDYRKNAVALILAPYLINIKKMQYDVAYETIKEWVDRCNEQRILDSTFTYKIKNSINTALRKEQLPMKFDTLKSKNRNLYDLLLMKMQEQEK